MPQSLHIVAVIQAQAQHLESVSVYAALRAAQPQVLAEDGCEHYAFYADAAQPTRLFAIERWRDQAALDTHGRAPAFQTLASALQGRAELKVHQLDPLD